MVACIFTALLTACTNKVATSSGTVRITMPTTAQLQSLASSSSTKALASKTNWGVTDPAAIAEINCFVIMYQGTEAANRRNSCTTTTGTVVSSPGLWFGGYSPGASTQITVPPGPSRIISIAGFKASTSDVCANITKTLDPTKFSAPFLLGSVTTDLSDGANNLSIEISLASALKFDTCTGPDFDGVKTSPSAPTSTVVKWVTMPSGGISNSTWATSGSLAIVDVNGNVVTQGPDASAVLTIALQHGTGALSGTNAGPFTVTALNGVADLTSLGLKLDSSGSDKVLSASKQNTSSSGGSPSVVGLSSQFAISSGVATDFVATLASTSPAGISTNLVVKILDASGSQVSNFTGTVTINSSDSQAILPTAYTFTAADAGQKTLPLLFKTSGAQSINIAVTALTTQNKSLLVVAGAATAITFTNQPTSFQQASLIPVISITATDAFGNLASAISVPVTLSLGYDANDSGTSIVNGSTINTISGVATFPNVGLNQFGNGYTLLASAPGVTSINSTEFNSVRALALIPSATSITVNMQSILSVVGGVGPYVFAVTSGTGSVTQSGVFQSSALGGATITVTDQSSNLSTSAYVATVIPSIYDSVAPGQLHGCGVTQTGFLRCWGANASGQLGNGTLLNSPTVVTIDPTTTYSSVVSGPMHSCAITSAHVLKCWGSNTSGQVGLPVSSAVTTPTIIDAGSLYSQVSLGQGHTCGLLTNGSIKCWGNNSSGQVGINSSSGTITTPTLVGTGYSFVSAGGSHTCAVKASSNELFCWGDNSEGQLGIGNTTNQLVPTDVGLQVTSLAAGTEHTCAINSSNALFCWGDNSYYELGNNSMVGSTTPLNIASGYSDVYSGFEASCAKSTSGGYYCWGYNGTGAISASGSFYINTPTLLSTNINLLFMGTGITCGTTFGSPAASCWGSNANGQTGNQTAFFNFSPLISSPGQNYKSVRTSTDYSLGITTAGELRGWGSLPGIGDSESVALSTGGNVVTKAASGANFFCYITSAGVLNCLGANDSGQLGNGSTTYSSSSVVADPGVAYSDLSLGYTSYYGCGITVAGVLKCWGANTYGQLGDGTTTNRLSPVTIDAGTSYYKVVTGTQSTCGITTSGQLKCWGSNTFGQLGDGTTTSRLAPALISAGQQFMDVAVGDAHSCAIGNDYKMYCWGLNSLGSLGDGTKVSHITPAIVTGTNSYKAVSASGYGTCAIAKNGDLKCWGTQSSFPLLATNTTQPTIFDAGTGYKTISVGLYRYCGVTNIGIAKCFGNFQGHSGSLGVELPYSIAPLATYLP